jgi:hypothetical protein
MSKKKDYRNNLDALETHMKHLEAHQKYVQQQEEQRMLDLFNNGTTAQKVEALQQGLISYEEARSLLGFGFTKVDFETRVQAITIDGREVLEWVV